MAAWRMTTWALFVMLGLMMLVDPTSAEQRNALVIGNSAYRKTSPLINPRNDAELVSRTLAGLGFNVTTILDADQPTMKRAMVEFGRVLRSSDTVGLFYYAGHGLQVGTRNYLVPVDASIADETEVGLATVALDELLATMERADSRINIVVLDACRNNPFARGFRSASGGLAPVLAPRGTFVAYATAPGAVAADGEQGNSPYTSALAKALVTPGASLEQVFKRTRFDVLSSTKGQQVPWETTSITGEFYFKPGTAGAPPPVSTVPPPRPAAPAPAPPRQPAAVPPPPSEAEFWATVRDTQNPEALAAFLRQFPTGQYAELAKLKLVALQPPPRPTVQPQPQPPRAQPQAPAQILAFSSTRAVTERDIRNLSCDQLWQARNEVFKRRGYCFDSERGQRVFGNVGCSTTRQDILNDLERDNVSAIKSYELRRGCDAAAGLPPPPVRSAVAPPPRAALTPISGATSVRALEDGDVSSLNCNTLWLARNELFHRHGYCFTTPRGKAAFGNGGCSTSSQDILSGIEKQNADLLRDWEQRKGC